MEKSFLGNLLHLSDPTLPIGGYTHSNGLETYVQLGLVNSKETATSYVRHMLQYNMKYNDGALMKLAYEATEQSDLSALVALDQECNALKAPREIRQASQKLGLRLIKIFRRSIKQDMLAEFEAQVQQRNADSHYCVVFGMLAQLLGIPIEEAVYAYYFNAAIGMITNAVKLVPLGQLDGQDILFELHDYLHELVKETLDMDRKLVGLCNIAFDIRCMQHERLYSRLYMS